MATKNMNPTFVDREWSITDDWRIQQKTKRKKGGRATWKNALAEITAISWTKTYRKKAKAPKEAAITVRIADMDEKDPPYVFRIAKLVDTRCPLQLRTAILGKTSDDVASKSLEFCDCSHYYCVFM